MAVQGESDLRAARAALHRAPGTGGDLALPGADDPLPSVAVPDADVDLHVDVRPVRARVLAALRAHATQVQAVAALDEGTLVGVYALSNGVLAPLLPSEQYRVAPAPAGAGGPAGVAWPAGVRRVA